MNKLALAVLLLIPCLAQDSSSDIQRTNGGVNGRLWQSLSSTSKLYLLVGFDEAMGLAQPYREKIYFPKVPYGDVVKGIDRFYEAPENLTFPVSDALQIFTLKVNGATQSEIEVRLREFRRDIKLAEELLKKK
jgi:hypothetical protein